MPIIRNPFKRASSATEAQDENTRPTPQRSSSGAGFQRANAVGSKPVDIKEPAEYKLSETTADNASQPSPPERKSFWSTTKSTSSTSSNHRKILSDTEPFSISRESFESYRRSFDISARTPLPEIDSRARQSLDSRQARLPRSSLNERRMGRPISTTDEGFEDVGLNDEVKPPTKKKGLFSRFGDSSDGTNGTTSSDSRPSSSHHGFHFGTGRKRGQSGQGAELSPMRPADHSVKEVFVESN
ncbi:uncharacterized protein K452DRAFT_324518 [Aplosporella prunicola CBS 121167]|uniref:Uncharacterized protein n=1 Tax=Aplosporella prunicola CBS 121167 TaxID=1176127 RepID=A0A6A6BQQ3_9PEZI|nr:uncharacterized protein K452DRAFT_324518 [Aplosporella prunicola CBS 121167]KAF2145574.1 hypothetical protein K452DRAFT_324518 [Aplosporella prunicola CBS 121167]